MLYGDRELFPSSLRPGVLNSIHVTHQVETAILSTTQSTVFWPGMTKNIVATRGTCRLRIKNSPLPPRKARSNTTQRLECAVAIYFDFKKINYVLVADRLSG